MWGMSQVLIDSGTPGGTPIRIVPGITATVFFLSLALVFRRRNFTKASIFIAILFGLVSLLSLLAFFEWIFFGLFHSR